MIKDLHFSFELAARRRLGRESGRVREEIVIGRALVSGSRHLVRLLKVHIRSLSALLAHCQILCLQIEFCYSYMNAAYSVELS